MIALQRGPGPSPCQGLHIVRTQEGAVSGAEAARQRLAQILAFSDEPITRNELVAALTYSLDLTAAGAAGHTLRSCLIGMRIGRQLRLTQQEMDDLYYALLLKDVGCSSNATELCEFMGMDEIQCRQAARTFDWSRLDWKQLRYLVRHAYARQPKVKRLQGLLHVLAERKSALRRLMQMRCLVGERIARDLHFSNATALAIRCLEAHWDGRGQPENLAGTDIPLLSQICSIAQTLDNFSQSQGQPQAVRVLQSRCGTWFDPGLVITAVLMHEAGRLWDSVPAPELLQTVIDLAPCPPEPEDDCSMEEVCEAFAEVVDAKSHYTFLHSHRVAQLARSIGAEMQLSGRELRMLHGAALLHDLGKLAIPNTILDKKGPLTEQERGIIHDHPVQSFEVLRRIRSFDGIARIARAHHERLDGTGYPDGLTTHAIPLLARILAIADKYDALSSERPYRKHLTQEEVLQLIEADVPHALDSEVFAALCRVLVHAREAVSQRDTA